MARKRKKPEPQTSKNNWGRGENFDWTFSGEKTRAREADFSTGILDLGRQGSSSSSGSGVTNSYVVAGGDPTDPNSIQINTQPNYNPAWPEWAKLAVQGSSATGQPNRDLASPLPTGKSLLTLPAGSPELQQRQQAAQKALQNPQEFIDENVAELNQDQTIIDKGLTFLGNLFNYEDEADLQIFGMNLSAVESTWDFAARYITGGRNVLDAGIGALISAMPGGIRTLEWGELTGNHTPWEVFSGEIGLEENVAPSPMQIAIASVAVEAKRIREGDARLSDLLLLNPATAPFLLAGIKADTSPLQKDGFNLLDPEQRKEGFGSGYEKFFSGIGDFGVQMASPMLASAAVAKAAQRGALGIARGGRTATHAAETGFAKGFDELTEVYSTPEQTLSNFADTSYSIVAKVDRHAKLVERRVKKQPFTRQYEVPETADLADGFWKEMDDAGLLRGKTVQEAKDTYTRGRQIDDVTPPEKVARPSHLRLVDDTRGPDLPTNDYDALIFSRYMDDSFDAWQSRELIRRASDNGDDILPMLQEARLFTRSSDEIEKATGKKLSPTARLMNDILQTDELGNKVLTRAQLEKRVEFRNNPYKAPVTALLHSIKDPYVLTLVFQSLHGSNTARQILTDLKPAISDDLYNMFANVARDRAYFESSKVADAKKMLEDAKVSLEQQRLTLDKDTARAHPIGYIDGPNGTKIKRYSHEVMTKPEALQQRANLDASIDQIDALVRYLDGENIDLMAPGPFYDADHAWKVAHDLYKDMDSITLALQDDIRNAMLVSNPDYRPIVGSRALITPETGAAKRALIEATTAPADWYARQVAKRRERNARARWEYSQEGAGWVPRKTIRAMRTVDENGNPLVKPVVEREWDFGWVSGSSYGNRFRRASRAWMWFGTETPAGYIGLKGSAIMGSEDELAAALDLDLYSGKGVEVSYIDKDGNAQVSMIGGEGRKRQLQEIWAKAVLDPHADPKTAIVTIERLMADDMARAYGIRGDKIPGSVGDKFDDMMLKADKYRGQQTEHARQNGTFIDPDSREIHHIPYLKQQLANGHYMHNWHFLERELQRNALRHYGVRAAGPVRKFETGMSTAVDITANLDNIFQQFWRPATLFRLSYTQRNVFEGMTRAMGYYGSLAPLIWPVQATWHGLDNARRARIVRKTEKEFTGRAAKKGDFVGGVVDKPVYKDLRADLNAASADHYSLMMAPLWQPTEAQWQRMLNSSELNHLDPTTPLPEKEMRWAWSRGADGEPVARMIDPDEYDALLDASFENMIRTRQALEPLEDELDRMAKGRFKTWRDKNIPELNDQVCAAKATIAQLDQLVLQGGLTAADMAQERIAQYGRLAVAQADLDTLRYDPAGAIGMWRQQYGRKKRIGSGTSIGPGGGTYGDAFSDEYSSINTGLLSSDISRKLSLSSASDAFSSIFRAQFMREYVPIAWNPHNTDDWTRGMARLIESNATNPLVRVLLENDLNADAAVEWMLRTEEGINFATYQRWLEGTDFEFGEVTRIADDSPVLPGMTEFQSESFRDVKAYRGKGEVSESTPDNQFETVDTRLKRTGEKIRNPITGQMEQIDYLKAVDNYAYMTANALYVQLQRVPQFVELAKRRARAIKQGSDVPVTQADVEDVLKTLTPEQHKNLGSVMGSEEIDIGTNGFMRMYRNAVNKMFHVIGTVPEDAVVRGPFYNKRFKQVRDMQIESYLAQTNPAALKGFKKGRVSKGGKFDPDDVTHGQFQIPSEELEAILRTSHRQALHDTREYLYTIERRTKLGKYGEHIWPFISAQQNTLTAGGKILYKNPWVGIAGVKLWTVPEQLGWQDDQGNTYLPLPLDWLNDQMKKVVGADIPIISSIAGGGNLITIPQNGLNVWAPDTGFLGVVPRPGPIAQITASNLMQIGAFPVDTPDAFKSMLGDRADGAYQMLKDYMFGDQGSMSDKPGSLDVLLPPWMRRIIDSKNELSSSYGYYYQLEWADQTRAAIAGERESWPTPEEINEKVTHKFWFYALGNFGAFGMTRPDVQKPLVNELQSIMQMYLDAQGKKNANGEYIIEPGQGMMAFNRDFGSDLVPLAMKGTSENTGGAEPTAATVADITAYNHLIRDVAPSLGEDKEILDILINNSNGPSDDYSDEALRWQRVNRIGATGEHWREPLTGEEATVNINKNAGWVEYRKFVDQQEAKMHSMGLKNMQQSGAAPLRQQKEIFVINMSKSNPDWYKDFTDGAAQRTPKVIDLMQKMVTDPVVQERMMSNNQESLYGSMAEYLYYRQQTVMAVEESGKPITAPENLPIREAWDTIRLRLKQQDTRWSDIATRWLDTDDNPTYAGEDLIDPQALALVMQGE